MSTTLFELACTLRNLSQNLLQYEYARANTQDVISAFSAYNKPGLTTRDVMKLVNEVDDKGCKISETTGRFIRRLLTDHRSTVVASSS